MSISLKNILKQSQKLLLPYTCCICNLNIEAHDIDLCVYCKELISNKERFCFKCETKKVSENGLCSNCAKQSNRKIDCYFFLATYEKFIRKMVLEFKYKDKLYYANIFSKLLHETIINDWYKNKPLPKAVIPIPMHHKKLRDRGFNQTNEVTRILAKSLNIHNLNYILTKSKHTKSQTKLNKEFRKINLLDSFKVKTHCSIHYKHIAIFDDIVTTMSTINEIKKLLINHFNIEKIDVWCLGRNYKQN